MKKNLLLPFSIEADNRNDFCFAMDLAKRLNCNLRIISAVRKKGTGFMENRSYGTNHMGVKDRIYGRILELAGYYQGYYNQWNSYEDVKIQLAVYEKGLNEALVFEMHKGENSSILINPENLGRTGLTEEIMSDLPENDITVFILPGNKDFRAPDPNLIGVVFNILKRENFSEFFSRIKILSLPGEIMEFEEEMMIRQAS